VVAVVIQRADAKTTPTATTEKKRKAALVLDNAAASFLDRWPSPAGATAIAIASGLRQSSLSFIGLRYAQHCLIATRSSRREDYQELIFLTVSRSSSIPMTCSQRQRHKGRQ
jgi:hypothetical protein